MATAIYAKALLSGESETAAIAKSRSHFLYFIRTIRTQLEERQLNYDGAIGISL